MKCRFQLFILLTALVSFQSVTAQKYFTRDGNISFHSDTPMEKIEAYNKNATAVLDVETGKLEFAVLIKAFHFEKALMEEHFNENYMDSNKYPKATFKGQIDNISDVAFTEDGDYEVSVSGDLTIHGVTNSVKTKSRITVEGQGVKAFSSFEITVADYDIKIPKVVRDNIAKIVRIDVDVSLQELKSKS